MKTTQIFPYPISQIVVKIGLILLAIYLTNVGVINKFLYFISLKKYFSFSVFLIIWASALIAIFCTAFNPDGKQRFFWGSLFVISTFGGQLYFAITGEQLSYDAIGVLWNARHRPEDALFFWGKNLIYPALASIFLFISVVIIPPFIKRGRNWILFISPMVPLTMIALTVYKLGGFVVAGLPAQFNTLSTAILFSLTPAQILKKNEVKISLKHKAMAKHIVLIIDESVHGEFISLKGNLNTTPFLKTQQPSIVNFGLALSGNNCSSASNAILRLGANPATLGHEHHHLLSSPSIWKYAKKAGFETTHLDAQMTKGRLVNFMNSVEYELVDHFIQIENVDYHEKDYEAARVLENLLKKPEPQFIYVNKRGCHFPYEHMYPAHKKIFTPCMAPNEPILNKEHLLNSYKNAVRWNVDGFFKTLLPNMDLTNFIFI
ncbi:MAG: sulfatase-like hydrolase/transferase [Alphaproteobacteria bacterium]|nr:sulfatase-like hydrolase/transferase [Alphaproteobacteria bacterium]